MRILVAVADNWMGDGLAHVLRAAVPGALLVQCGKDDLLRSVDPASGCFAAAIVAFPWHSLATLRTLRRHQPDTTLIACTSVQDSDTHQMLLAASVAAVVADSAPPAIVGSLVQVALYGGASLHARSLWTGSMWTAERGEHGARRLNALNLTARQFDVLRFLATGHSNLAIAEALGIGMRTVKGHVGVILRALHTDNRRTAGRNARRWLARHQTLLQDTDTAA